MSLINHSELPILLLFISIVFSNFENYYLNAAKVACNACIYHAVASNLNTHILGSKNHYIDFGFEIPCTFYNPIITVSVPNGFKINSLKLIPGTKTGEFHDTDTKCENSDTYIDYRVNNGILASNINGSSDKLSEYANKYDKNIPTCELSNKAESEFLDILKSLGFENWQVVSQNTSKCLDIPEYVVKSNEVLKLMGNLNNGSYTLRFDLQNAETNELAGNWNLSITSTRNNMPTTPFCLTNVSQESVTNTLGPLMSDLNILNVTTYSYYKGSQVSEFYFALDQKVKYELPSNFLVSLEPIRIRLTFPKCENSNDCFKINTSKPDYDNFCEIIDHNYECYIQSKNPQLVLILGLSESTSGSINDIFPIRIRIKNVEIPKELDSTQKLKIEVLVGSVPSSRPEFLDLNATIIEKIRIKNECIGEWIEYLFENKNIYNGMNKQRNGENANYYSNYSPISIGYYHFTKIKDIDVKIRYRITESEIYPVLVRIGKISNKVKGNYNLKIRPLIKNVNFVKEGLENEITYSSVLLRPLIYDKSLNQEDVRIQYNEETNSILLLDIDPNYPFECTLIINSKNLGSRVISNNSNNEKMQEEWEIELYSAFPHNNSSTFSRVLKRRIKGEVYDKKETSVSEIGGPFVFVDSKGNYSMVIYFYVSRHQSNKVMAINLKIPETLIKELNNELNVGVYPPKISDAKRLNILKYIKKRKVLTILLESHGGYSEGWWGLSVQITTPSLIQSIESNIYVEFNVSSSELTIDNPYLTSLLFLGVNENYMGPYLEPKVSKLLDYSKRNYFFQLISVQQRHNSFHPFPLLKNQLINLETNSPDYLISKLTYRENFRYVYILDENSLNGREINLDRIEIRDKNIGNSVCLVFLVIGNGYFKQLNCKMKIKYSRIDGDGNNSAEHRERKADINTILKIIRNTMASREKYVMNLFTLVIEKSNVEELDKNIFLSKEISPSERVNYSFIIKKEDMQVLTLRLNLDPDPRYYCNYSQFNKLLVYNQYYNLYTVPSSVNALKTCPPEVPLLSNEKAQNHPLLFSYTKYPG